MSITLLDFDARQVTVSVSEAMRYMGVRGDAPEIKAIAEDLLAELRDKATLRACYTELPVAFGVNTVSVGTITTESKSLRKNLTGCSSAVLFAATIGAGADKLIARYAKLAPSKSVVLGALGSAMIEGWCDEICRRLSREYGEFGRSLKPRFSPGYGGFDLSAQTEIGQILDTGRKIGLYFTDSLMMIPEKSVTALVGITDPGNTECVADDGCASCSMTDCGFRK